MPVIEDERRLCWVCGLPGKQWVNSIVVLECDRHPEGLVRWSVPLTKDDS